MEQSTWMELLLSPSAELWAHEAAASQNHKQQSTQSSSLVGARGAAHLKHMEQMLLGRWSKANGAEQMEQLLSPSLYSNSPEA